MNQKLIEEEYDDDFMDVDNNEIEKVDFIDLAIEIEREIEEELRKEKEFFFEMEYNKNQQIDSDIIQSWVSNSDQNYVCCPVCKKNPLLTNKNFFFCNCKFKIDNRDGYLSLKQFGQFVDSAIKEHNSFCNGNTVFEKRTKLNREFLIINCNTCQKWKIVL